MKRILGVKDLFSIGYADLGSSIYYALGITALYALGAAPISLMIAGLVFICTALTYAEMTSSFHESGGSASYARHAFNDLISFIAGWGLLLDYIVTIAISAFTVSPYLAYFYAGLKEPVIHTIATIVIIFVLFAINLVGVRQSARMSFILTSFTLLTQAVIIVIGFIFLFNFWTVFDHMRINVPDVPWSPSWTDFWKGTAMAMVAYTGIESIAQLGAEAKRPEKSSPRAIFLTMIVLVLMYLCISLVALSALTPQQLSTTYVEDPIAGIVSGLPVGSRVLGPWVGILAAILLFVAANAGLIGSSRLAFNMGEYYQLPRLFYRLHSRFRTPYVSLLFFAIVASLLIIWSRARIDFLADLYNFGAMLAFFFAHLSLIMMRIKHPDLERPFRIPFNLRIGQFRIPITACIGCLATLAVWALVVITKPYGRYLGFAWMIFGLAMFFAYRRAQRISPTGQLAIQKVEIPDFKTIEVKKILVLTRRYVQTQTIQMACEIARMHGSEITALHVIKIHSTLPLDTALPARVAAAEAALKHAEAIAREYRVPITLQLIRARSAVDVVVDVAAKGKYDLIVVGVTPPRTGKPYKTLGTVIDRILRKAPCRVLIDYTLEHHLISRAS
jgi:basic amino acid/polyamine antiporter, APA family